MIKKRLFFYIISLLISNYIKAIEIPEMIYIEGNSFIQGSNNSYTLHKVEKSNIPDISYFMHTVTIDSFYVSKYEITIKEFNEFVNETGYETYAKKQWLEWLDNSTHPYTYNSRYQSSEFENFPITEVTYVDILEYCKWLSKKTGERFRLPTESEWEYIATSGKQNLYPWGNEYKVIHQGKIISDFLDIKYDEDILPVLDTQNDSGEFQVCGMFGNVREFCLDTFDPLFYIKKYDNNPLQIECLYPTEENTYRGYAGYNMEFPENDGVTKRFSISNTYYSNSLGFRIVKEYGNTVFNKDTDMECVYNYCSGIINDNYINTRNLPSLQGQKNGQLMKNDKINIFYRTNKTTVIDNNEDYWYFVRKQDATTGTKCFWVFGNYIDFE